MKEILFTKQQAGRMGGLARAKKMSKKQRVRSARFAANKRWNKDNGKSPKGTWLHGNRK